MVRRGYTKLFITLVKWILLVSSIYGLILFATVNFSREFDQETTNSSAAKLPSQGTVNKVKQPARQSKVKDKVESKGGSIKENVPALEDAETENVISQDDVVEKEFQSQENAVTEDASPQEGTVKEKLPSPKSVVTDKQPLQLTEKTERKQSGQSTGGLIDKGEISQNLLCPKLSFPSYLFLKSAWQPVDSANTMYVFSAYKVKDTVYVIGVRPRNDVYVICQFWQVQKNMKTPVVVMETEATVKGGKYDRGYRYISTVFECKIDSTLNPSIVSLVMKNCDTPSNIKMIQKVIRRGSYQRRLTVCVPPLKSKYNNVGHFVRWFEINKLFGVDKFVVYNYSSGVDLDRVLRRYSRAGTADIVSWRPPMVVEGQPREVHPAEIEKYGEIAALNDCLFRNKQFSEFISNININEYLVPHSDKAMTLTDMINNMETKAAAYHVNIAFIKPNITKTEQANKKPEIAKPKPPVDYEKVMPRSKLIIRTSDVDFASVENVPGVNSVSIPLDKLLMHRAGINRPQKLGSSIESILPSSVINKAETNVQSVLADVPQAN